MLNILTLPVLVPVAAAIGGVLFKRLRNEFGFVGMLLTFYYAIRIYFVTRSATLNYTIADFRSVSLGLSVDAFSGFVILGCSFFGLLVLLYSFRSMRSHARLKGYYAYLLLTLACTNGAVLAHSLVLLLVFWGALLILLYGLLTIGKGVTGDTVSRAFVTLGISDCLMLLGVVLLFAKTGKTDIGFEPRLGFADPALVVAYVLLAAGCLGRAGAFPFHRWVDAAARVAPPTTMAFIPASLNVLLGIYLLARVSYSMFDLGTSTGLRIFLMSVGAVTVVVPLLAALVHKDALRLVSLHSVSQVGYLAIGLGTGTSAGIAGACMLMLCHSVYGSGLLLTLGSIEDRVKTTEIARFGGLGRQMPVTLFSFAVAVLAFASVPPLSGFFSKVMVAEGILDTGHRSAPVFLAVVILGTGLTLGSFLRLLGSFLFGSRPAGVARLRETGFVMWSVTSILALLCILFGVWFRLPLRLFVYPSLRAMGIDTSGSPVSSGAAGLIGIGIVFGLALYLWDAVRRPKPGAVETFVRTGHVVARAVWGAVKKWLRDTRHSRNTRG